ncbi:MAG: DUF3179 domain-containing protein [Acidobacteriia bacterium]|nr:DUF3179 domain-containing protein [Terriglobia bacterium]
MIANTQLKRWIFMVVMLVSLLVSLACVVYPMYVIRPFRAQGAGELAAALVVARFRGLTTVVCGLVALAAVALYWRVQTRRWRRILTATGAGFVCVLAVLARVNVYELMFHPADHPAFTAAAQVKIDKDDKVLVVKINGEARAYPIRTMGYHHVLNDVVGKTAIVATY